MGSRLACGRILFVNGLSGESQTWGNRETMSMRSGDLEQQISRIPEYTSTTGLKNVHNYGRIMHKKGGALFMPQIRPITDLRNTNEISDACHAVKEPIFITKNGYGDLVVMSIETYEQIAETQLIDNAIAEAEEEYEKTGILLDAKETLAGLRRKRFG